MTPKTPKSLNRLPPISLSQYMQDRARLKLVAHRRRGHAGCLLLSWEALFCLQIFFPKYCHFFQVLEAKQVLETSISKLSFLSIITRLFNKTNNFGLYLQSTHLYVHNLSITFEMRRCFTSRCSSATKQVCYESVIL